MSDSEPIFGTTDQQKATCVRELETVVDDLLKRGTFPGAVCAALAELSVRCVKDAKARAGFKPSTLYRPQED